VKCEMKRLKKPTTPLARIDKLLKINPFSAIIVGNHDFF